MARYVLASPQTEDHEWRLHMLCALARLLPAESASFQSHHQVVRAVQVILHNKFNFTKHTAELIVDFMFLYLLSSKDYFIYTTHIVES